MRRGMHNTGLEGAPDIMLLTMAALMVAIVWLVSQARDLTLPPIDLPSAEHARLSSTSAAGVNVTLRLGTGGALEVYLEEERVPDDLDGLEGSLLALGRVELILRADERTEWKSILRAMDIAADLGLTISVAAER